MFFYWVLFSLECRMAKWQKWQNDELTTWRNDKNDNMTTWRNGKRTNEQLERTGLQWRKSASHPQAGLGRLAQRFQLYTRNAMEWMGRFQNFKVQGYLFIVFFRFLLSFLPAGPETPRSQVKFWFFWGQKWCFFFRKWCEALFLHLGLLQNAWVGSIWHFLDL